MRPLVVVPIALLIVALTACDSTFGTAGVVDPPTMEEAYLATLRLTRSAAPPELLEMIRAGDTARTIEETNRFGFALVSCWPLRAPATHECLVKTLKPAGTVTLRYRKEAAGWVVAQQQ